ncbi:MAG TPA: LysM peptidoglycan-binding domain-containing protein [Bellilinea sp.]|nr:LysM peptidoglycan-binding domain-containing protein [Bellilinea sp.]
MVGAVATGMMVIGAIGLGLLEAVPLSISSPTPRPTLPQPNLTPLPGTEHTAAPRSGLPTPLALATLAFTPTACPPPAGWEGYVVNPGDDLLALGKTRGATQEQIMGGNCLISMLVIPGTVIYLPPVAIGAHTPQPMTATPLALMPTSTQSCQRPAGWIEYTVKFGDNLTRIAINYRITVSYLKQVNCLTDNTIRVGMKLWVPNVPTSTPVPTATPTQTPTDEPEPPTATPIPPTEVPTLPDTLVPTPTETLTPTYTDTPTNAPIPTEPPAPTVVPGLSGMSWRTTKREF